MAKQQKQPETDTQQAEEFDHREALLEGQGEPEEQTQDEQTPADDEKTDETNETGESDETTLPPGDPAAEGDVQEDQDQQTDQETPEFLTALKQLGWECDSVEEAQQSLLQAFQNQHSQIEELRSRYEEQEELARFGTQFLKEQREREEAEAKAKQQEDGPEPWWNPPSFDPAVVEQYRDVTLDENGAPVIGWKKNTPKEIVNNAERYQDYLERWAEDLVRRPQEVLPKIIEQEFDKLFDERITAREQAAEMQTFAEEVKSSNSDWMYTTDSRGQQMLTPEGQVMTQLLAQVADDGITDPRLQWEYAVARYDYLNRQREQEVEDSTSSAKQVAQQKRQEHLQKAQNKSPRANRTGTIAKPDESQSLSQNPNLSPGQQLLEQMQRDGYEF